MPGARLRPQPRVRNKKAHEHSHHGHAGFARHSPRNGFNGLLRALPGVPGLLATVVGGLRLVLPGWADFASAKPDASVGASGPHDFAVRS